MRINQSYSNALEKPFYQIFENSIQAVLPVVASGEELSERDRKILDIIRDKACCRRNILLKKREPEEAYSVENKAYEKQPGIHTME